MVHFRLPNLGTLYVRLPIGIKDLFCTKGVPSQAASRILENFRPA